MTTSELLSMIVNNFGLVTITRTDSGLYRMEARGCFSESCSIRKIHDGEAIDTMVAWFVDALVRPPIDKQE